MATQKLPLSPRSQSEQPKVSLVRIAPEAAKAILAENDHPFRALSQSRVKQYADDMVRDKWILTGDPIRFDKNGVLIDGGHRLAAVSFSKKGQDFIVMEGLDPESIWAIDTGMPRTAAQIIGRLRPELPNPAILVAAARWVENYRFAVETGSSLRVAYHRVRTLSTQWLDKVIQQHNPGLSASVLMTRVFKGRGIDPRTIPQSIAAFAHYNASLTDPLKASTFFASIAEGVVEKPKANWKLDQWIRVQRQQHPDRAIDRYEFCTLTIRAWKAYEAGRQGVNLKYDREAPVDLFLYDELAAKAKTA